MKKVTLDGVEYEISPDSPRTQDHAELLDKLVEVVNDLSGSDTGFDFNSATAADNVVLSRSNDATTNSSQAALTFKNTIAHSSGDLEYNFTRSDDTSLLKIDKEGDATLLGDLSLAGDNIEFSGTNAHVIKSNTNSTSATADVAAVTIKSTATLDATDLVFDVQNHLSESLIKVDKSGDTTFKGTTTCTNAVLTGTTVALTGTSANRIASATSAGNASSSTAALTIQATAALDANDLVLNVENNAGTDLLKVDYEGDTSVAGALNVGGATLALTGTTANKITSAAADGNTSASVAAITIQATGALTANDLVLDVQNSAGTSLLKVDDAGDTTLNGDLVAEGSILTNDMTMTMANVGPNRIVSKSTNAGGVNGSVAALTFQAYETLTEGDVLFKFSRDSDTTLATINKEGDLEIAGSFISGDPLTFTDPLLSFLSTDPNVITSATSAAQANSTTAALTVKSTAALNSNDLVFAVADSADTALLTVDAEGDVSAAGDLAVGDDVAIAGNNIEFTANAGGNTITVYKDVSTTTAAFAIKERSGGSTAGELIFGVQRLNTNVFTVDNQGSISSAGDDIALTSTHPHLLTVGTTAVQADSTSAAFGIKASQALDSTDAVFNIKDSTDTQLLKLTAAGDFTVSGPEMRVSSNSFVTSAAPSASVASLTVTTANVADSELAFKVSDAGGNGLSVTGAGDVKAYNNFVQSGTSLTLASGLANSIVSDTNATQTSASVAALTLKSSVALDANDLVLDVQNNAGTSLLKADYEGDVTVAGVLNVPATVALTGTGSNSVTSGTTAGTAGTNAAIVLKSTNTLTGTDQILDVKNNGTSLFKIRTTAINVPLEVVDFTSLSPMVLYARGNSGYEQSAFNIICDNVSLTGSSSVFGVYTTATEPAFGVTRDGDISMLGKIDIFDPDGSSLPGNITMNYGAGKAAFAIGASTVVVTNSKVTADSIVIATLQAADATLTQILRVVPASGSFTVTGNAAATAATKFCWVVLS